MKRILFKFITTFNLIYTYVTLLQAQNFMDGFNFYLPPQDTTIQRFLPQFPIQSLDNNEFVCVDDNGHFAVSGQPIRFWGTNAVADGAFPKKSKAWFIAGRLRKMGFNLVRFHHMDNSWSPGSLFEWGQDTRHLNPETLDRFENFIAELKKNGIYANINLHVSRTFNENDGVPDADSIKNFGKGVTYFDPQLIELQKEYAKQLLAHVNPYTGLSLVEDPVMAMVEITNENSLYRMWRDGKLKPFTRGGDLTVRHDNLLNSLWQDYLIEKYSNTDSLRRAWNRGIREVGTEDQIEDGGFEHAPITRYWQLELHNPANGAMGAEVSNPYAGNFSARIIVSQTDGIDWHVQWKHIHLTIEKDSLYTISFAGRADANRTITVSVMRDSSPWTGFYAETFVLTPDWQMFDFSFRAPATFRREIRLSFSLGREIGTYWFDEIHFTSSEIKGLADEESLETQTVKRIDFSKCTSFSDIRVMDMTSFYLKLQSDFFSNMMNYLKNQLGVKVPVVGTNWNVGPPDMAIQSQLDYIDNHAYWDHPFFPNIPWSSTDWLINNTAMVLSTSGGTIPLLLGGVGFYGKPFTISEYNHAFPNRYQTEGVLFLSSYAAFHDVDGIMFFDYSSESEDWETDRVNGYFSIHRNTAMMALMPSCAQAYRERLIDPAQQMFLLDYSYDDVLLMPKYDSRDW
ncbi:MAG: carbohydrate binding domain-containing protein, partial [bacterium]